MATSNPLVLTKTTRELILSRLDEIRERLDLFERLEGAETENREFNQWHDLEGDILRVERERLKKVLINNEFKFLQ